MGDFMNRGKNLGTGFKNRGPVIEGGSFTNRGAEDQPGREFKNRGQAWFNGPFKNRGQTALESSAAWSPAALFVASEVGAWYDPSDLSTMWTDDGTTQAGVGDLIYRIDDKSGNGLHAKQTVESSRPTLRESGGKYYLEFDGVDDQLSSLLPAQTNPMPPALVAAAGKALADTALAGLFGDSRGTSVYTTISKQATTKQWGFVDRSGTTNIYNNEVTTNIGDVCVLVGYTSRTTSNLILNNVDVNAADSITGDVEWAVQRTIWIGNFRSSSTPIAGHFYGGVFRYSTTSAEEIDLVEAYLADKSGVTL